MRVAPELNSLGVMEMNERICARVCACLGKSKGYVMLYICQCACATKTTHSGCRCGDGRVKVRQYIFWEGGDDEVNDPICDIE